VLDVTAAHAADVTASVAALPDVQRTALAVLPHADTLLGALTAASRELGPGVSALSAALPDLAALEQDAPAIDELAAVGRAVRPTMRAFSPLLAKLGGPASALTPLSTPVAELADVLIPYGSELREAPLGFTRWGDFRYSFGTGAGHRAVRLSMVMTCALARDPYPAPGAAAKERKACP
jgi:hypothetical protein